MELYQTIDGETEVKITPDADHKGVINMSALIPKSDIEDGKYGLEGQKANAENNRNTCLGFKGQFTKNFKFDDAQTHVHVRNRVLSFYSYQGDEVIFSGSVDVTVKLPPIQDSQDYRICPLPV